MHFTSHITLLPLGCELPAQPSPKDSFPSSVETPLCNPSVLEVAQCAQSLSALTRPMRSFAQCARSFSALLRSVRSLRAVFLRSPVVLVLSVLVLLCVWAQVSGASNLAWPRGVRRRSWLACGRQQLQESGLQWRREGDQRQLLIPLLLLLLLCLRWQSGQ